MPIRGIDAAMKNPLIFVAVMFALFAFEQPAHAGFWQWCGQRVGLVGKSVASAVASKPTPITFENLASKANGEEGLKLVSSLQSDRFYEGNPFSYLTDFAPVAAILERGVSGFERTIYRTSVNVRAWNSGYDVVLYRVKHADDSQSVILGAKRMSSPYDVIFMGGPDMRKVHQSVYVAKGDGNFLVYEFEGGILKGSSLTSHPLVEAVDQFVEESIANRGFYLLSRPDELIVDRG